MNTKKWTALDLVQIALVAGLYVALTLTPPLNAIAYGAYQFRVSEISPARCRCTTSCSFRV